MNKTEILKDYNGKILELSKLINSWNLVKGSSKESFEGLSEKILKNLYEGQNELKITRIVEVNYVLLMDYIQQNLTQINLQKK